MYRKILFLICVVCCSALYAQTHMRVHFKDGGHSDVQVEEIDSITFVDGSNVPMGEFGLIGCWLWGDVEAGYFELLTFNKDKTYIGYDNYFTYGFSTETYGWYWLHGTMLTLQSSGFGYSRHFNWFVIGLTDNALEVMTKNGRFVYYRLQQRVIHLHVGEELSTCDYGDTFVFADGVIAGIVDGKLKGLMSGTTYIETCNIDEGTMSAYMVVVE